MTTIDAIMTRIAIEDALGRGDLWAAMRNGRYWKLRRNGATQLWKTRPNDFRIPVKCGFKTCTRITETSGVALKGDRDWKSANFVISETDPN